MIYFLNFACLQFTAKLFYLRLDPKGDFKKRPHTVAAAVGSTGFVLFVISCILIACSIYIITVYRAKKKQEEKGEEECGLLDMEYTEM